MLPAALERMPVSEQHPYGPTGYHSRPAVPPYYQAAHRGTNSLAVTSLIFGCLMFSLIAIIAGHLALGEIRRTGEYGRGLAIAGLVIGYTSGLVVAFAAACLVVGLRGM